MSYTSVDKPFDCKISKILEKDGIRIWYNKHEIKVGEFIF